MANYTLDQLLLRLEDLRNDAVTARNELLDLHPEKPSDDPRVLVGRHIKAAISSSYLSLIHLHENLLETAWWRREGFKVALEKGTVQGEVDDYWTLLKWGLIVVPFTLFEAGLRRIVRAIDPNACSRGAAEFKSMYDWLLRRLHDDGWRYPGGETVQFLDLYRNLRNTIHNNGSFYSRTGTDVDITWKGTMYKFRHATVAPFVDWDFNLTLVRELVHLNRSLMEAGLIQRLSMIP